MPKRLIVLCDGSGQSVHRGAASIPTNVKRFGDCLSQFYQGMDGKKHPQIVYYQSGVGTASSLDVYNKWALGTGAGIEDNILDAYSFLCNNYSPGDPDENHPAAIPPDEICIFGFSRGAFTARVVANLVCRLGLFKPQHLWMLRSAWAQYLSEDTVKNTDDKADVNFEFFIRHLGCFDSFFRRMAKVKVVGVWDTVGSVGLPPYAWAQAMGWNGKQNLFDTRLRRETEHAFHALALDEYRLPFGPTLFHYDDPLRPPYKRAADSQGEQDRASSSGGDEDGGLNPIASSETNQNDASKPTAKTDANHALKTEVNKKPILKQCWFAGAHTDIGGGYPSEHQSNITLAWMIDQCMQYQLLDFETTDNFGTFQRTIRSHLSPGLLNDQLHRIQALWYGGKKKAPCEERYPGWGCGIVRDSWKDMTTAVSWQYRMPGNYTSPFMCKKHSKTHYMHPGAEGVSYLPGTDAFTAVKSSIMTGFGLWGSSKEPGKDEYCTEEGCRHPVKAWNKPGGTNETIHESVWERFKNLKEMKDGDGSQFLNIKWAPRSLSGFMSDGGYRRVEIQNDDQAKEYGYTHKWIGRCVVSKKCFDIYEEPDSFQPGATVGTLSVANILTKQIEPMSYPSVSMMHHLKYKECWPDKKCWPVDAKPFRPPKQELNGLDLSQETRKRMGDIQWDYRRPDFNCNEFREEHKDWATILQEVSDARRKKREEDKKKPKAEAKIPGRKIVNGCTCARKVSQ